jgi:hypothetical protein
VLAVLIELPTALGAAGPHFCGVTDFQGTELADKPLEMLNEITAITKIAADDAPRFCTAVSPEDMEATADQPHRLRFSPGRFIHVP